LNEYSGETPRLTAVLPFDVARAFGADMRLPLPPLVEHLGFNSALTFEDAIFGANISFFALGIGILALVIVFLCEMPSNLSMLADAADRPASKSESDSL
jgi:hypothetical protein